MREGKSEGRQDGGKKERKKEGKNEIRQDGGNKERKQERRRKEKEGMK